MSLKGVGMVSGWQVAVKSSWGHAEADDVERQEASTGRGEVVWATTRGWLRNKGGFRDGWRHSLVPR